MKYSGLCWDFPQIGDKTYTFSFACFLGLNNPQKMLELFIKVSHTFIFRASKLCTIDHVKKIYRWQLTQKLKVHDLLTQFILFQCCQVDCDASSDCRAWNCENNNTHFQRIVKCPNWPYLTETAHRMLLKALPYNVRWYSVSEYVTLILNHMMSSVAFDKFSLIVSLKLNP